MLIRLINQVNTIHKLFPKKTHVKVTIVKVAKVVKVIAVKAFLAKATLIRHHVKKNRQ